MRPRRALGEQIEIERIVAILEEGLLTTVAALGYMMRDARQNEAREARHGRFISGSKRHDN
ncbi:hypothetical protein O4H52_11665 [Sphingomonadaceae bacterium G21617-S1]|jgi:hypothetical protein|nr:hypothetical protein [Sphingomonadaceae bacterium G21617-S1]